MGRESETDLYHALQLRCRDCGATLTVPARPWMNEAPIMGRAVAVGCAGSE